MAKEYSQMSYYQRLRLKEMLDKNYSKVRMAEQLGVHRSTIFNELKRGSINGVYDPDYAEERAINKSMNGGEKSILERDKRLAAYISRLILDDHLSPEAVTEYLKEADHEFTEYPSSPVTIYTAIDRGLIPDVSRDNLNVHIDMDIVAVAAGGIRLPKWLREKMKIKNGDRIKFECRKNGDILLRRIKGETEAYEKGSRKKGIPSDNRGKEADCGVT